MVNGLELDELEKKHDVKKFVVEYLLDEDEALKNKKNNLSQLFWKPTTMKISVGYKIDDFKPMIEEQNKRI